MTDHDAPRPATSPVHALLAMLRRRAWLALAVFAVVATAAGGVVGFLPSVYQASATVAIDQRNVPEAFVKSAVTGGVETRLHLINQDVLSTRRLDDLIGQLDPYPSRGGADGRKAKIERMRRDTRMELKSVDRKSHGDTVTIAFTIIHRGPQPEMAARVANTLATSYVEENVKARAGQATATAAFLKTQLEETKARLETMGKRLEEFNAKHAGSLPQQIGVNIVAAERLQTDLRLNAEDQRRARERRDALMDGVDMAAVRPGGPAPAFVSPRAMQLTRLREELAELRRHYTDRFPDVARVQAEIARVEAQPDEAPPAGANAPSASVATDPAAARRTRALKQVEGEIAALVADERRMRGQLALYQSRIDQAPRHDQEARQLSRDYETTRDLYQSLLTRYGEAQMGETLEHGRQTGEQFRILEPAVAPEAPVAPNRQRLLLVGLAAALGLAAAAVVVAEKFDTSFHSEDDLRTFTAVPIATTIPAIVTDEDRRARRRRTLVAAVGAAGVLVIVAGGAYLAAHGNYALVALLAKSG